MASQSSNERAFVWIRLLSRNRWSGNDESEKIGIYATVRRKLGNRPKTRSTVVRNRKKQFCERVVGMSQKPSYGRVNSG
jgi:hypothetical protein